MRAYLVTTGAVFGLLFLAHVARVFAEGTYLIREPVFLITTLVSGGACFWAIALFKKLARHS